MRSVFLLALLSLCLSVGLCSPLAAQSSTPILPGSEPLWLQLNEIAKTLPTQYDSFMASLTTQVDFLQASNQSLQEINVSLLDSNQSLTLHNADLQNSLKTSQGQVATLEKKSTLLQKDIADSIAYTGQVEADAKAVEFQLKVWRVVGIVAPVVAVAAVVYAILKK